MKYSLDITNDIPEKAVKARIDERGFVILTGYLQVYRYSDLTREYTRTLWVYSRDGSGIAAGSTLEAPKIPDNDEIAIVRSKDGKKWLYLTDHRGKTVYDITNRAPSTIAYIGDLKAGFTFLEPKTRFDYWDGEKWVTDKKYEKKDAIQSAKYEKHYQIDSASEIIQPLQDAVDLDMATDEEKIQLRNWKFYRLSLHRKDISTAPDIDWPPEPE
ncbi:MAG: tail fiber assembly protein [Candidatus Phlomobacter fragariae]